MDQEAKSSFSFASIAVSFFILIVLPLTITGVIISKGVVKVGEEATQANLRILDDSQKLSIGARTQAVADAVAQFLSDVEKDMRIASILPRDVNSYATFLKSNTRGLVQSSQVGVVRIPVPVYHEIQFLNKDGSGSSGWLPTVRSLRGTSRLHRRSSLSAPRGLRRASSTWVPWRGPM